MIRWYCDLYWRTSRSARRMQPSSSVRHWASSDRHSFWATRFTIGGRDVFERASRHARSISAMVTSRLSDPDSWGPRPPRAPCRLFHWPDTGICWWHKRRRLQQSVSKWTVDGLAIVWKVNLDFRLRECLNWSHRKKVPSIELKSWRASEKWVTRKTFIGSVSDKWAKIWHCCSQLCGPVIDERRIFWSDTGNAQGEQRQRIS